MSRGVSNETTLVYSLGLVEFHSSVTQSFQSIENFTGKRTSSLSVMCSACETGKML
jgi:hypothetical protein